MLGTRNAGEETVAPGLTSRVWLLIPLVAVGLVGIFVPLAMPAPRTFEQVRADRKKEERVPYRDDLATLLRRPGLPDAALRDIAALHRDLQAEAASAGGTIPKSRGVLVRRLLETYDR